MKTTITSAVRLLLALFLGLALHAQPTGFNQTGAGPYDYNDGGNWVGGTINGIWHPDLSLVGSPAVTFSTDTILGYGLNFSYGNVSGGDVTLRGNGDRTLTLGGDILHNTANNRTVNFGSTSGQILNVDLGGATRTFTVASGRILGFVNVISNGGVTVFGGTVNFSGANSYSGATTVRTGNLSLNGASGSVANSDVTVRANNATTTLTFNSNSGSGTTRAKSVTLSGLNASGTATATLAVTGNSGANSIDTITNALAVEGYGIVSMGPNASRNSRLVAASLSVGAGSTVYFRGTNLGVNEIASQTANSANIQFTAAPALVGGVGSANTSTVGILPRAYGSLLTSNNNGDGLVTYDTTFGIRLLDTATEYTSAITSGQTALDNVRLVGSTGANLTNTLGVPTTIGSLSLIVPTVASGGAGVTVTGAGTLTIGSGTVFAKQSITGGAGFPTASDAMTISVPTLAFGTKEAVIIVAQTNSQSSPTNFTNAPLIIDSVITGDNGLTKAGSGYLRLGGSAANTYAGTTTVNAGTLGLNKSSGVNAIPGDLVIQAGGVYLVSSHQIPDSANITIHSGSMNFRPSNNTGSSTSDTFNDLLMKGGSFSAGSAGANSAAIMQDATLEGGSMVLNRNNKVTVNGLLEISGGATITVNRANSTTSLADTLLTLGGLAITHTASGAYTPITLAAGTSGTNLGGRMVLAGDVSFAGNGTNSETARIDATSDAGPLGVIALNGTRSFNIGNGAAVVDLAIVPDLQDGAGAGGLIKTGLGTLALQGDASYTGPTDINQGLLLVNGTHTGGGAFTVNNGGTLGGGGTIGPAVTVKNGGTLSPGASAGLISMSDLSLESGSFTDLEIAGGGGVAGTDFDQVLLTGALSLAGTLNIDAIGGYDLELPGSFQLFDGFTSRSGNFAAVNVGAIPLAFSATSWKGTQNLAQFDFDIDSGVLTVSAIPEPGTLGLLLVSGIALALGLRRRRV